MTAHLSIIFGTFNRLRYLRETIDQCWGSSHPLSIEFIIADGGSTDGTIGWLRDEPDITLIEQHELLGACQALNACCELVSAPYVCHLNDDALPMGDCLYQAYRYLVNNDDVGQVALAFRDINAEDSRYHTGRILNKYYANFGITRRWLGNYVGWFSGGYLTYSCDQELSFKIQEQGYQVVYLGGCKVNHYRVQDVIREKWRSDHGEPVKFLSRWKGKVSSFPKNPIITEEQCKR